MPIANSRLERLQLKKLLQCINGKDLDQIKKLVEHGVPNIINYNDPDNGITAMISAVKSDDINIIELLLSLGACTDIVDFDGKTALMIAAELGYENVLKKLLEKGPNRDANDFRERNVLFYCVSPTNSHLKCLSLLLDKNINIDKQDVEGQTVLHSACKKSTENEKLILKLLSHGANPNIRSIDNEGNNPLHMVAKINEMCCKFLGQRGCDAKIRIQMGSYHETLQLMRRKSFVFEAELTERFTEIGQRLTSELEVGRESKESDFSDSRDLNSRNDFQASEQSLITAVGEASAPLLSDQPSSQRSTSRKRKRSKHRSTSRSKSRKAPITRIPVEEFTSVIASLDGPINDIVVKKLLALHEKNSDGCIDWKEFLTGKKYLNKNYLLSAFEKKKGKKKKKKGGKGVKRRKIPMDICVLPSEAIYRRADGGPPIMYIPKQIHHTDTSRFDADHPPSHPLQDDSAWYLDTPRRQYISFHAAAMHNDLDSIRLALSEGYKIDTRDKFYKTPLMVAAHHGNLDAAIELIKLGADVNARDNFRWTPLHHAAHSGMIDMVELLLNNGAIIEAKALNGATPLFRAIECSRLNVVDYFLSKGSKLFVETRKGENPYVVALNWSDPRVIEHVHDKWELAQEAAEKQKKQGSAKRKRLYCTLMLSFLLEALAPAVMHKIIANTFDPLTYYSLLNAKLRLVKC
ncbi:unnamed protein product [Heterobilharzia americana]|nr:unnamed protein product [Heterobilharzia americana]